MTRPPGTPPDATPPDPAAPGPALRHGAAGGGPCEDDVLARFSAPTRAWFRAAFAAPTTAQSGAWQAISEGDDALVVAPTGSGKTLAAFLWALDRLGSPSAPGTPAPAGPRVLYVSPLKALASDVERNLRGPLAGIRQAAARLEVEYPDVRVGIRSGDTAPDERRAMLRRPPDILITTPESLFLLLTSRARETLTSVQTVIVDEVHVLAGSKRGAHLAVSLERLESLVSGAAPPAPVRSPPAAAHRAVQRIGLSATVRPVEVVARWLSGPDLPGGSRIRVVQPPSEKVFDLRVSVTVPDLESPPEPEPDPASGEAAAYDDLGGPAAGAARRASVWPFIEARIAELISTHTTTLVFANSRRLAERLTARVNEIGDDASAADREIGPGTAWPAQVQAQSGAALGAAPVLARAHHGSVSKEQRRLIEGDLKAGRLPAVVATSSLELGIDMGAIDLVVQVQAPPSVAAGLQRVGRAGHQVGAVSTGVLFPTHRGDLLPTTVVVDGMRRGAIESVTVPANPLDVLAQQIVAMVAMDPWTVDDILNLARRTAPFATLSRTVLDAVLDMLSGRYASDEFASLRPRVLWDRHSDVLTGLPGAQRLAVTSGGTIPDRGLYGVFLVGEGAGRRVGELDEEMVYESRVGDVFTLGTTSWRIQEITPDQVRVTPAPGQPGRLPFWKGDPAGRPAEVGKALGRLTRELTELLRHETTQQTADGTATGTAARDRLHALGLDEWAVDNTLDYLRDQVAATVDVPDDRTLVVERFRDELGDWRVAVHSPFGGRVNTPWALAVAARFRERFGVDVQALGSDDGILLRLPDLDLEDGWSREIADLVVLDPEQLEDLVTEQLGGSALFAARFRECAARALLLPRRRPDGRQPLWQQRQRAAQLLEVAGRYGSFPIVLEAVRECLQDVFDLPALVSLMRDVEQRRIRLVDVETGQPSPFARNLLFGYVAQFVYDGDAPLAERRAAALALDPALLAELLGKAEGAQTRDLLDPQTVLSLERDLQCLSPERRGRDAEGVADLLRRLGPLDVEALRRRSRPPVRARTADPQTPDEATADEATAGEDDVRTWLAALAAQRRVIPVRIAGRDVWAAVEDAGRLRDALGVALPTGVAEAYTEPVADPLADLVSRHARTHGPFPAEDVARRFGLGTAVVGDVLRRLVAAGRLTQGALRPIGLAAADAGAPAAPSSGPGGGPDGGPGSGEAAARSGEDVPEYCDVEVLRVLRRRSLAALRAEVEPVPQRALARFTPAWAGVVPAGRTRPGSGVDGVLRAVEQLAGAWLPASAVESLILPARVPGYSPAWLDELLGEAEVTWAGHQGLPGDDGWVSLHPSDLAGLTLPPPDPGFVPGDLHVALESALAAGGAFLFRELAGVVGGTPSEGRATSDLVRALWDLVWAGRITNDTFAPVRALVGGSHAGGRRPAATRHRSSSRYASLRAARARIGGPAGVAAAGGGPGFTPPLASGRWSVLPPREQDRTLVAQATAEVLLERHGIVTRGAVSAEHVEGGFAAVYRVLAAMEDVGRVRRGYFVEGLGAAQFGTGGAIDRLRAENRLVDPVGDVAPFASTGAADASGPGSPPGPTGPPGPGGRGLFPGTPEVMRSVVLSAADPANPYGATLDWPDGRDDEAGEATPRPARPSRAAGALVVLVDGELILHVGRGGRTLLSWSDDAGPLQAAADTLALAVRDGALGKLTVSKADGTDVLTPGAKDLPLSRALMQAGFHPTTRGLRIRA